MWLNVNEINIKKIQFGQLWALLSFWVMPPLVGYHALKWGASWEFCVTLGTMPVVGHVGTVSTWTKRENKARLQTDGRN
jgi:hypothetical protein